MPNRKQIVFQHNNTRLHSSLVTRQNLLEFGSDLLPHPPYGPDLAPSDYHLCRSLKNYLDGKKFNNDVYSLQFFTSKEQKFHELGIMILPERWQKVIDNNGQYCIA